MTEPQMILHVGAPKCGSSALQTALSMTPDLVDTQGRRLRYTAWHPAAPLQRLLYGRSLTLFAQRSAFGYANWPDVAPADREAAVFAGLEKAWRKGLRTGHVPIMSNEGWIGHADVFAQHLARWGHPPIEVVAFLRPVVDWVNSAFWQWGIWHVPNMNGWLERSNLQYRFAHDLEKWSRLPNVRLRFARARPNAVTRFANWQNVTLPQAEERNSSSSPALIGVLLRNRRFRQTGHDSAIEFVVQRWCPPVGGRKLWAIQAKHVHVLRPIATETLEILRRLAVDDEAADLLDDPRWTQEMPYHKDIRAGVSPLDDRAEMAALYTALSEGVSRAAAAIGTSCPDLPACPEADQPLDVWDDVLVLLLDRLLAFDKKARQETFRQNGLAGMRLGLGEVIGSGLKRTGTHRLFKRSR